MPPIPEILSASLASILVLGSLYELYQGPDRNQHILDTHLDAPVDKRGSV